MDKPIRVLQVMSSMNRGGAETMIMNIYRNIDRSKVQFDFVVHGEKKYDYEDEIISLGGNIYKIPSFNKYKIKEYNIFWNNFFEKHLEYRIIHGHMRSTAYLYLKIARKHNRITIAHSHNTSSGKGFKGFRKRLMHYPLRRVCDYCFACSLESGQWLFGNKIIHRDNFKVIYNAVDLEKFSFNEEIRQKYRKEFGVTEKEYLIGHVGRFQEQKNHTFIIDVFNNICLNNDDFKLILIGDGYLKKAIEKKANDYGINDKVIFTGVRKDVNNLMQAMDVFILPSLHEGLPLVLIEAQAAGLPCFISENVTSKDIVKTKGLNVLKHNNIEEWATAIVQRNKRISMSKDELKKYDIRFESKKLSTFYLSLNNDKRGN
jgi:glycosyltransferase involved in cell wall biosynthesis